MSGDSPPEISESSATPPLFPTPSATRFERLLAGIQAGVAAFFVSILWLGLFSRLEGRSFWTVPNIMGGLFHGLLSVRPDFGVPTLGGLAVQTLLCVGIAAIASQLIGPNAPLLRSLAMGLLLGTAWFYLWDGFFWRQAFPAFAVYSKRPPIFFSHVLIGLCIGLYSIFVRPSRMPETRI